MQSILERFRRDGWLAALLAACLAACLLLSGTGGSTASDEEAHLAAILSSIEGAGRVEVAVFYSHAEDNVPTGALIVAQGAGDMGVQVRLTRAVMALLGLDADQIVICQLKEGA